MGDCLYEHVGIWSRFYGLRKAVPQEIVMFYTNKEQLFSCAILLLHILFSISYVVDDFRQYKCTLLLIGNMREGGTFQFILVLACLSNMAR